MCARGDRGPAHQSHDAVKARRPSRLARQHRSSASLHPHLLPSAFPPLLLSTIMPADRKPYAVRSHAVSLIQAHNSQLSQRPEPRQKAGDGKWLHDKAPGARKRGLVAQATMPSTLAAAAGPGQATRLQVSNLHYEITPSDLSVRPFVPLTCVQPANAAAAVHLRADWHARADARTQGLRAHARPPTRTSCRPQTSPSLLLEKYDRSGRSSGVAVVFFETAGEATRAKNQYDGVLAKGRCRFLALLR